MTMTSTKILQNNYSCLLKFVVDNVNMYQQCIWEQKLKNALYFAKLNIYGEKYNDASSARDEIT